MNRLIISNLLGLIGAAAGGVLGFYTFGWLWHYGFYGMAIPGAFVGLGCGLLAQHRSLARGIVCGAGAFLLSIYTESRYYALPGEDSFIYMVSHFYKLSPVTLLMIAIGSAIAFWVGQDAGLRLLPGSRKPPPGEANPQSSREEV